MIRVDHWYLASSPLDMRCGMDRMLMQIIAHFGAAQPHTAYAFANARASRMKVLVHDGFGIWLCVRRLNQGCLRWPRGDAPHYPLSQAQWQALTVGLHWESLHHHASILTL